MFKYSIKSELTRKYYERRLRKFLDFIQFEIGIKEIEKRCNNFAEKGKNNVNWTMNQIIRFLHFQKERSRKRGDNSKLFFAITTNTSAFYPTDEQTR